jgi:hypothetical protein
MAYIALVDENKGFVVVDGVAEKTFDGFSHLVFSPDSSRVAYRAQIGSKQLVVENGKEGNHYDGVGWITFSPDSKHMAYSGSMNGKDYLVLDGKEGKSYDFIVSKIFFDPAGFIHFLAVDRLSPEVDEVLLVVEKIE